MQTGATGDIRQVYVSADGRLGVAGMDENVLVWATESGECIGVLQGHAAPVYAVTMLSDSRRLLSLALDGTLRLWDLEKESSLGMITRLERSAIGMAATPDGKSMLFAAGPTIFALDLESGEILTSFTAENEFQESHRAWKPISGH